MPYANLGNPQSLNLYAYVKNNPRSFGDPDGHDGPGAPAIPLTVGGNISISEAFWTVGSVLLPGVMGGGLAAYGMNTIAGNNYIEANATEMEIHASNQLAMAKNNANKTPSPGTQTKTGNSARPGTLGETGPPSHS